MALISVETALAMSSELEFGCLKAHFGREKKNSQRFHCVRDATHFTWAQTGKKEDEAEEEAGEV